MMKHSIIRYIITNFDDSLYWNGYSHYGYGKDNKSVYNILIVNDLINAKIFFSEIEAKKVLSKFSEENVVQTISKFKVNINDLYVKKLKISYEIKE